MSKQKKRRNGIIALVIIALFAVVLMYAKEKYTEQTTKRNFLDKNQKWADAANEQACSAKLDALNVTLEDDEDAGEDDYYITCSPGTNALANLGQSSGASFSLTNMKGASSKSSTFTCSSSSSKTKVSIDDFADFNMTLSAKFDFTDNNGTSCTTKTIDLSNGDGEVGGGDGSELKDPNAGTDEVEDPADDPDGDDTSDVDDDDDADTGESDESDLANDLSDFDDEETTEVDNEKVQRNRKPYRDTSKVPYATKPVKGEDYYGYDTLEDEMKKSDRTIKYEKIKWVDGGGDYRTSDAEFGSGITKDEKKATKDSKIITLQCDYKLTDYDIEQIEKYNRQAKEDKDGKLTHYYYDDSNTTYLYGKQYDEYTVHAGTYKYHFNNRYTYKKEVNVTCEKTCEEIVKVEYGPPVYTQAGLCFEYRVKVTSIVKCKSKMKHKPDKPKKNSEKCTPKPHCPGSRQGGPTEDFDSCVKKCDGGKYTETCSTKCYQEVYEGTEEEQYIDENLQYGLSYATTPKYIKSTPQADCRGKCIDSSCKGKKGKKKTKCENKCTKKCNESSGTVDSDAGTSGKDKVSGTYPQTPNKRSTCASTAIYGGGYYFTGKGNKVTYCPHSDQNVYKCGGKNYPVKNAGLWYIRNHYKVHHYSSKYAADKKGIIRACYGSKYCGQPCGWSGCKKKSKKYLDFSWSLTADTKCSAKHNYGTYEYETKDGKTKTAYVCSWKGLRTKDYRKNMKVYWTAKEACKIETKCSTKISSYTIGFNYNTKDGDVVKTEKVEYPVDKKPETLVKDNSAKKDSDKMILLSYGGCYHNSKVKRWYQTEWTFPGTWISAKLTRSYFTPEDKENYDFYPGKVCLPIDGVNTNAKWSKRYYEAYFKESRRVIGPDGKNLITQWRCTFEHEGDYDSYNDKKPDGYNIYASIPRAADTEQSKSNGFGFFGWNIKVYCFYGLINHPESDEVPSNDENTDNCGKDECKGSKCESASDVNIHTYNATSDPTNADERIQLRGKNNVGFNWTNAAKLNKFKNTGGGYDIDPEVLRTAIQEKKLNKAEFIYHIEPETIAKIRAYNKKYPVGSFDNKYEDNYKHEAKNGVIIYRSEFLRKQLPSYTGIKVTQSYSYDQLAGMNNSNATYVAENGGK